MRCTVMKGSFNSAASFPAAPVRGAVARLVLESALEHPRLEPGRIARRRAARVARKQAAEPGLHEATTPGRNEPRVTSQLLLDRRPRLALVEQQDQPSTTNLRHRRRTAALQSHQFVALATRQVHLFHAPSSRCNLIGSLD
jgi:hypothetical protein